MSELQFQEEGHVYTIGDEVIPSVTKILEPLAGYAGVPDWILAAAADRGTEVHKMCELFDYGTLGEYNPGYKGYLDAWEKFLIESGFEVELIERRMFHPTLRYAGTVDRVGYHKGKRGILDIKTTVALMPVVGPQTAGYEALCNANDDDEIKFRWAVQLKPDGTYRRESLTDRIDMSAFTSCLNLYRWKEKHHG